MLYTFRQMWLKVTLQVKTHDGFMKCDALLYMKLPDRKYIKQLKSDPPLTTTKNALQT